MNPTYNVLFLCTGNSARSVLAEVLLNAMGHGRFKAYSAGSHPGNEVNPHTLRFLSKSGLDTTGLRSKSWDEFAVPGAPHMDFVITVCDNAAGEVCPLWPGQPVSAHWGLPDPAAVQGSDEAKQRAFATTAAALQRRLELFVALPMARLDAMALKKELAVIGQEASPKVAP